MSKVAAAIRTREDARKPKPVKPSKAKKPAESETVEAGVQETSPEVAE